MLTVRTCLLAMLLHASVAASAQAQERQWMLDAAGEDAFLIYGVPDTNDVGVSFWCKLGSHKLSLFTSVRRPESAIERVPLELRLGQSLFALEATLNAEGQPPTAEAVLEPQEQIRQALQSAESMGLMVLAHKSVYPLADADLAGLFTLCDQPPQAIE